MTFQLDGKPTKKESTRLLTIFLELYEPSSTDRTTVKKIFNYLKKNSEFDKLVKNKKINCQSLGQRIAYWIRKGLLPPAFPKGEKLSTGGKEYNLKRKTVKTDDDRKSELDVDDAKTVDNVAVCIDVKKEEELREKMRKINFLLEVGIIATKEEYDEMRNELKIWYLNG
jgi:hypothetical protein